MAEHGSDAARPADPVGRALLFCAYALILVGGFLMAALTVMSVVSVLGRYLFSAPIPGDFELVTMGTAIAVFLFLPYCHLQNGNIVVDLFLSWAPRRARVFFDGMSGLLLAAISGVLSWRMVLGGLDMHRYGEVSYILALPIWPVFPFAVVALALLAASCLYTAARDFRDMMR
ncbi:MAG: TRAP transporter small permease [Rhodospirillales bacterium]|nr:MAG: TRAP transporter small permease [Rhodospirillales bacterium]